jgi:hypothetical protein
MERLKIEYDDVMDRYPQTLGPSRVSFNYFHAAFKKKTL